MRARPNPVEALATLLRVHDTGERRANFRQAITALGHDLGHGVADAPPLEGIDPDVIARAAKLALELGFIDELEWLAPAAAAVALYEISAALPAGKTRRELGRRVFARLYEGTAGTFAAVASRMALTSTHPFETPTLRARVSLLFDLPIGSSVNAGPLALTLVTRRELRERWVDAAVTGTLPARRLAAKIVEHAAREAVFRAQQGDLQPAELLNAEPIRSAYLPLLADREALVWRHVAVARGLLCVTLPALREELELGLDPALSPLDWRRAAVSQVALAANDPDSALRDCQRLLQGPLVELDRGLLADMVLGLPRVIEAEPDAAHRILSWLAAGQRADVAEAMAGLLADLQQPAFAERALAVLRDSSRSQAQARSSALRSITDMALRRLNGNLDDPDDVVAQVRSALIAYETDGARMAFELAGRAAQSLTRAMDFVAVNDPHDEQLLPYVLRTLSDIDSTALERPRLSDLLLLGRRPGDTDVAVAEIEQLHQRLGHWLLDATRTAPSAPTAMQSFGESQRLRALLRLMDVDTRHEEDREVRLRVCRTVQVLLGIIVQGPSASIELTVCAALARALDAAVREGIAEPADLLLTLAPSIPHVVTYRAVVDASTNLDVRGVLRAYADFISKTASDSQEPSTDSASFDAQPGLLGLEPDARVAERVLRLSRGLGAGGSYRGEALRRLVLRLGRALTAVANAKDQAELVEITGAGTDVLGELQVVLEALQRLVHGAQRRLSAEQQPLEPNAAGVPSAGLCALVEHAVSRNLAAPLLEIEGAVRDLVKDLPPGLARAITQVLSRLQTLPLQAQKEAQAIPLERRRAPLPDWLLPRRTLGAFYIVRSLGTGGASSVFLARRLEERKNPKAQGFALKVPAYDPTIARSLTEPQFLQLFREEASALLGLPRHPNLAEFVTFDVGARPKPILVMELIDGLSLERLIRTRALSLPLALACLDGILAGLEAMHAVGVAHLDVKPSNVILRHGREPVLVDFGLSGRHLRPGCGTPDYSAPEVFAPVSEAALETPLPADVYAFGCLAFEALTGDVLFDGANEQLVFQQHAAHDGWPERLTPFAHEAQSAAVAKIIAACLRRDPRHRPSAAQLRPALARLSPQLSRGGWPMAVARPQRRAHG